MHSILIWIYCVDNKSKNPEYNDVMLKRPSDPVHCWLVWRKADEAARDYRYRGIEETDISDTDWVVSIHLDSYRLPRPHMLELRLLEIGDNPDVIERHNVEHLLADTHVLTDLHIFLSNDSRDWRANDCVVQVQVCLRKLRPSLRHLGVGR